MLITINKKEVLSLGHLQRAALKFIYDKHNMSFSEEREMCDSIVNWNNHLSLKRDCGETNAVDEEHMIILERIAWMLREDQNGRFDKRKAMFEEHGIDYKKYHRLPEAFTTQDFINGQKALYEAMEANPEDYQ